MSKFILNITIEKNTALSKYWLKSKTLKILKSLNLSSPLELSLLITNDRTMTSLNKKFRGINETTDVLSFSFLSAHNYFSNLDFVLPPETITNIGEIIISYEQAEKQSRELSLSVEDEITTLILHGILHLLGYDHELAKERKIMQAKEKEILDLL
jgi:probable rRNA maturation factor